MSVLGTLFAPNEWARDKVMPLASPLSNEQVGRTKGLRIQGFEDSREAGAAPRPRRSIASSLRRSLFFLCVSVPLWFVFATSASARASDNDVAKLLDGVAEIAAPGVPGPLCVFGAKAFPVVAGKIGEQQAAVVAASRLVTGRIVAFGHG